MVASKSFGVLACSCLRNISRFGTRMLLWRKYSEQWEWFALKLFRFRCLMAWTWNQNWTKYVVWCWNYCHHVISYASFIASYSFLLIYYSFKHVLNLFLYIFLIYVLYWPGWWQLVERIRLRQHMRLAALLLFIAYILYIIWHSFVFYFVSFNQISFLVGKTLN